jgi:hypothetical protein
MSSGPAAGPRPAPWSLRLLRAAAPGTPDPVWRVTHDLATNVILRRPQIHPRAIRPTSKDKRPAYRPGSQEK